MRVLVFVLNNPDHLQPILNEFGSIGIKGCTVLDTKGIGRELAKRPDVFTITLGSIRRMLQAHLKPSKMLMLVVDEEKFNPVIEAYESIAGNLSEQDTGIAFSFPLDFVKGVKL